MTATPLLETLRQALAHYPEGGLCVGFSGGPDSTALLHALAQLPAARGRGLRAIHVDHGLHPDSLDWAVRCQSLCDARGVPLTIQHVHVERQSGKGLEAAARDARYAAFAATLHTGEALLTAHHQNDQAETVLLKLLRGAGPEGLGGMRVRRPFAAGWLWRPLLDTPRAVLVHYIRAHQLPAIDDPANQSPHHARNFLRADILPRLLQRWPQALQTLGHAAGLHRDAADYLHLCSAEKLQTLCDPSDTSLDASAWLALHRALQNPVLEQWLYAQQLTAPTTAQREQLAHQIRTAAPDRVPQVCWPGTAVHLWRGRLYAHRPLPPAPAHWRSSWDGSAIQLPAAAGTLRLVTDNAPVTLSPPPLEIRLGKLGIHLKPAGDRHTRALRDLFQQAAIVPWLRRHCPAIYASDGTLLAIADLWLTNAGQALFDRLQARLIWEPMISHPLRHRAR